MKIEMIRLGYVEAFLMDQDIEVFIKEVNDKAK